jgi:transcriptional regulator with XRE-family HTH domain
VSFAAEADNLVRRRKALGWSAEKHAREAGVSLRQANRVLAGQHTDGGVAAKLELALRGGEQTASQAAEPATAIAMAEERPAHDEVYRSSIMAQELEYERILQEAGINAKAGPDQSLRPLVEGLKRDPAYQARQQAGRSALAKGEVSNYIEAITKTARQNGLSWDQQFAKLYEDPDRRPHLDQVAVERQERTATAKAEALLPLGVDILGQPVDREAHMLDDEQYQAREAILRANDAELTQVEKAAAPALDQKGTTTSPEPRGIQELYNSARNWAEENDREDLVFGDIEVLIKAYLDAGGGPVGKSERRVRVSKSEYDGYLKWLVDADGRRWFQNDFARVALAKANKSPVRLPDTYDGIARMNPEGKHAFIANSTNPDKCVACGNSLGHDHHWTEAGL